MVNIKLNMMNVTTFILNGIVATIAVIFYFLNLFPSRESNFKAWIGCLIFMIFYGIAMVVLMVVAIVIERKKTKIKGPIFSVYGYRLLASEYDRSFEEQGDRWYITIEYSVTNKGDIVGLFEYYADLILDVKDHKGELLSSKSSGTIKRKIKAKEILFDQFGSQHFFVFYFNNIVAENWQKAKLKFKGRYLDHEFDWHDIDYKEFEIENTLIQHP